MWARRREEKVGQRRNSTITPLCRPSSRTTHTHTHLSVIVSSKRRARRSTTSVRLPPCRPFIEAASSTSLPTTCSLLLAALAEHDDADRCDAQEKTRLSSFTCTITLSEVQGDLFIVAPPRVRRFERNAGVLVVGPSSPQSSSPDGPDRLSV